MQNVSIKNTCSEISNMISALKNSIDAIGEINECFETQKQLLSENSDLNDRISDSIEQENREFTQVNQMIIGNAANSEEMAGQVDTLKKMIERMNRLLA